MHVIVFCLVPNINNTILMHWKRGGHGFKSRIDLNIFQALFSLFNTAKITFKFISDTDTILRVCTWLQIIDILVKSVVNIHFVFASKNAFSVANMANTVLNSIVMLVCFFAFQKLWQS